MRFIQSIVLGAVLSVSGWSQAAIAHAHAPADTQAGLRFDQMIADAVLVAPSLAARQAQLLATREDAVRAAAFPDPSLSASLENLPVTGSDAFDLAADEMTMKRIGITQVIPARAKRQALQGLADRRIDEANAMTIAELLSVRRNAAQAWIALWAAEREVAALLHLRATASVAVAIAKARLSGGSGTAVEAMAVQAAALELENRITGAESDVAMARGTMARWLDVAPAGLTTAGEPPDLFVLPVSEAFLLGSVERQGPLLPWASREAVAEAEVTLARAQKKPDWSVGASYGQRSGQRSDMLSLEFSIDLPVFAGNRQDRGITARRADLDATAAAHEDARRAQIESVHHLLAEWEGLKQQVARKEQQMLPLARDRAQAAAAGYRGGGELQPWLEARRDELELHTEHARHLGELGRAWAALAYLVPSMGERP